MAAVERRTKQVIPAISAEAAARPHEQQAAERRCLQDMLEDDEVREALKELHAHQAPEAEPPAGR